MASLFFIRKKYSFGCWRVGDNLSGRKNNRKDDETFADDFQETLKICTYNIFLTHGLKFCHGKLQFTPENPQTESWKEHSDSISNNVPLALPETKYSYSN